MKRYITKINAAKVNSVDCKCIKVHLSAGSADDYFEHWSDPSYDIEEICFSLYADILNSFMSANKNYLLYDTQGFLALGDRAEPSLLRKAFEGEDNMIYLAKGQIEVQQDLSTENLILNHILLRFLDYYCDGNSLQFCSKNRSKELNSIEKIINDCYDKYDEIYRWSLTEDANFEMN